MAKKKNTPISILADADAKNKAMTERCVKAVDAQYTKAIAELSTIAQMVKQQPDGTFTFEKNPAALKKVEAVLQRLNHNITAIIGEGDRKAWNGACEKSQKFMESVLKTSKLPKAQLESYKDRNLEALAAFQERKVNGLNLSDRVWTHVKKLKGEVELVASTMPQKDAINTEKALQKLEHGIGSGMSAAELSREVRSCLKEPNKLFRRVRNKNGKLILSKPAQLYHPGQGVYRSSYKNAVRMTRTEINMAYRQSDQMQWQQMDYVIGFKVNLSNTHDEDDICDNLHGDYPKTFKFVGWHPQCKCFVTPIMKTLDELEKELENDGYEGMPCGREVNEPPAAFNDYIRNNMGRIQGWKNVPYYIQDNPQFVDKAMNPGKYVKKALVLDQDITKKLSEYDIYGVNHAGSKKFNDALKKAKIAQLAGDQKAFDEAMILMEKTMKANERSAALYALKKEQQENISLKERQEQYLKLKNDPNYKDVQFDRKTGGLKATHVGHNFDKSKGWYETTAQNVGYKEGHVVILEKEDHTKYKVRNAEGLWDGMKFEIATSENGTSTNIRNSLKHCSRKPDCEVAVVFLPNEYNNEEIEKGLSLFQGLKGKENQWKEFKGGIYFIHDGRIKKHYLQPEVVEVAGTMGVYTNAVTFHRTAKIGKKSLTAQEIAKKKAEEEAKKKEMERAAAKKRIEEATKKRHEARTEEYVRDMQKAWNIDRLKANYSYSDVETIESMIKRYGLDRSMLDNLMYSKLKVNRGVYTELESLSVKYEDMRDQAIERANKQYDTLFSIGQKLRSIGSASAMRQYKRIEEYLNQVNSMESRIAYVNGKKFQNSIDHMKKKLDDIMQHRKDVLKAWDERQAKMAASGGYSVKMPKSLEAKSVYLEGENYMFNREFFDTLKEQPILQLVLNKNGGSYESGGNLVHIEGKNRLHASSYQRKKVIYHEYGHAIVEQRGLLHDPELKTMMANHNTMLRKIHDKDGKAYFKWVREYNYDKKCYEYKKKQCSCFADYVDARIRDIQSKVYKMDASTFAKRGITRDDVIESLCSTADTLKSLVRQYGYGHTDSYFKSAENKMHEYMAHAFENNYLGNEIFKKLMPDIYDDMIAYVGQILKQNKDFAPTWKMR